MGMDVYGKAPTTKEGEYFRNNVWWWRPLADYVVKVAPEIACKCNYWQSNDGDGLNAQDARLLADALQVEIDTGRTTNYAIVYAGNLQALPNEPCTICDGTGTRLPIPQTGAGDPKHGGIKCNGCDGNGYRRPTETYYPFSIENVQEFITFLRASGGFEIN